MLLRLVILAPIIAAACSYPPLPDVGGGSNSGLCGNDSDCRMPGFSFCNTDKGTCAPCFARQGKNACPSTAPHCDVDSCTACVDDTECPNSVCMLDGSCASPASVIHVLVNGQDQAPCGSPGAASACKLDAALALAASDGTKNVIKLDDSGMYMSGMDNFVVNANVTIDLHGATLMHNMDGPIVTIAVGKNVTLLGGTIMGAHGPTGSGILCNNATLKVDQTMILASAQLGIDATSCPLRVTRAKIENSGSTGIKASGGSITLANTWLDTNAGGGVDINSGAQFTVVGNVFVKNGTMASQIGGININTSVESNRLEFNSIAENSAQGTISGGVTCTANLGFVAKNNIIWSNNSFVNLMMGIQVSGGCGHSYSDIGPAGILGPINIGNNQNMDPKFKNKTSDLRLTADSPLQALQQADPGSNLADIAAKDIDGDPRVAPVYIGAYQYKP
jgi:hypothetical protein